MTSLLAWLAWQHCQPVSQYSAHHGPGYCSQEHGHTQDHQTDKHSSQDISLLRHLLHRQLHRPVGLAVIHFPRGLQRGSRSLESAFSHNTEVRPRLLLHWVLLGLSHLQQFGHCRCKEMEPVVCPSMALCLHSFQNIPHRLLHLRDSLQTLQLWPNLPAVPDDVSDVGPETHAEAVLYPGHGATSRD